MKTLEINGVTFQVINKRDKDAMKHRLDYLVNHYTGESIYTAYTRPSDTKIAIYERWLNWSRSADVKCFEVAGHNCMTFTLHAIYQPSWNETYIVEITPSNNRLLKVS